MPQKYNMGQVVPHKKVKLIVGFIFTDEGILEKAESLITKKFGPADYRGPVIDFTHTGYYNEELGENLKRKFISLHRLVSPEKIYRKKLITNSIEQRLLKSGKRTTNIDPGYITEGKLVLLTTKDHGHRVYLEGGIYAESTLKFQNGTYQNWETTYPDYKTGAYISAFNEIRRLYREQLGRNTDEHRWNRR